MRGSAHGEPHPTDSVPDWAPALGAQGHNWDQPHLHALFLGSLTSQPQNVTVPHCEQATVKHFWDIKAKETFFPTNLGAEGKYY